MELLERPVVVNSNGLRTSEQYITAEHEHYHLQYTSPAFQ
jgi:hypothetical protein